MTGGSANLLCVDTWYTVMENRFGRRPGQADSDCVLPVDCSNPAADASSGKI
ncbi:MAG: hypothetical protein HGA97_04480 [Chlorobiaceae bacterium]|nr:hypothetical protein [Chlorobiaceae bacterium]